MLGVVQFINDATHNETNEDFELATKLFKSAYNSIVEVNSQVNCSASIISSSSFAPSPVEIRSVADFINYKICQLQFKLNKPRDAITQFRRYIDTFKQHTKDPEYIFEHAAWLSQQYLLFADLFDHAITLGAKPSKAYHPGFYYQEAALQMIDRRKNITEYTNDTIRYSNMPVTNDLLQLFSASTFPLFLRQCGWTSVDIGIRPPLELSVQTSHIPQPPLFPPSVISSNSTLESNSQDGDNLGENLDDAPVSGVDILNNDCGNFSKFNPINYSQIIIDSLKKALKHFKEWNKPRFVSYINVLLADEYIIVGKREEAQSIYQTCLGMYENERWFHIVHSIRQKLSLLKKPEAMEIQNNPPIILSE